LPEKSAVSLTVYDLFGRIVKILANNSYYDSGRNAITWNGTDEKNLQIQDGLYLLKIESNSIIESKKLIICQ